VNRKIRRHLSKAKRKIDERLAGFRRAPVRGEPVFTASNVKYEVSNRVQAINAGGIGLVHKMVRKLGLAEVIDEYLHLLKLHLPYHESDHVLNIAYNILCNGKVLDDLEVLRNNAAYLDALGVNTIPDPTTAGDFCRRFEIEHIYTLMDAVNKVRLKVWKSQPDKFFDTARVDVDGIFVDTYGECKEGMDINYKGQWGYHVLLASLANTQEPLFLVNRSGNRPSHEGAPAIIDKSVALLRDAGFRQIIVRGDTDFSLTAHFDRWDKQSVTFVFGVDASAPMKDRASFCGLQDELIRKARELKTTPRERPENFKQQVIEQRNFTDFRLVSEDVGEFDHRPEKCEKAYRVVVVRKNLMVLKGGDPLFPDTRFFFYITNNREMTMEEVVKESNDRCNQENLGAQLKGGVRALRAPLGSLESNWAYMVMASLAWSLKAWLALSLPEAGREKEQNVLAKRELLAMEFRTFLNAIVLVPAQIIRAGRRIIYRLLAWNPWQPTFFRLATILNC
jgi:hypothetical protein